jgi:hypothetical protein
MVGTRTGTPLELTVDPPRQQYPGRPRAPRAAEYERRGVGDDLAHGVNRRQPALLFGPLTLILAEFTKSGYPIQEPLSSVPWLLDRLRLERASRE